MCDSLEKMKKLLKELKSETAVKKVVVTRLIYKGAHGITTGQLLNAVRPMGGDSTGINDYKQALSMIFNADTTIAYCIERVKALDARFKGKFGVKLSDETGARRYWKVPEFLAKAKDMCEKIFNNQAVKAGSSKTRRDLLRQAVKERYK